MTEPDPSVVGAITSAATEANLLEDDACLERTRQGSYASCTSPRADPSFWRS